MKAYKELSYFYDEFTTDVPYDSFINYYKQIFEKYSKNPKLILDLGCGTGTLTIKMAEQDFEMIGIDMSEDMLMEAQDKSFDMEKNRPIFLKQAMENLDLFGTIDACISSLDCVNYITDKEKLKKAFDRVCLFLEDNGLFIFDINTKHKLKNLDGQSYVRESDDVFCVWQAGFKDDLCTYDFDIFVKKEEKYDRFVETHIERAYEIEEITKMLEEVGFYDISCFDEFSFNKADEQCQRVFFVCKGGKNGR